MSDRDWDIQQWLDTPDDDIEPDPEEHTDRVQNDMCDDYGVAGHWLIAKAAVGFTTLLLVYGYWPRGGH